MNVRAWFERFLPANQVNPEEHERVAAAVREANVVQAQARQWALEVALYKRARRRTERAHER